MKKDEGKPELSLVYTSLVNAVARVRKYGVQKHGSMDGWKTTPTLQHYDACLRHMFASVDAEREGDTKAMYDKESGELHLAHAVCNIMFLIEEYLDKCLTKDIIEGGKDE